jgi:DNA-binding MarR family transcriptional regulator
MGSTSNHPTGLRFDPIAEAQRQWIRHGWPQHIPMMAVVSITRVQQLMLTQVERALRPFDLTLARYEALVLLYFSSKGSLPLGKIGERLQVHPTSVTNTIDRLQHQELVRRVPHPADRRATLAEITPKGRQLVPEATKVIIETLANMPFTVSEAEQIFELLQRFRERSGDFVNLEAEPADAAPIGAATRDVP